MPVAISIEALGKTYKRRFSAPLKAVREFSLSIPAGQVYGLLGHNGAGKTTTIKMICGLVTPTSGRVLLNGYDVRRQKSHAMRQVGAVLEGTRNVYWRLSPWENLTYFGRLKGKGGSELRERAKTLLTELDLWERRNDPVMTFSRGMQQKVAIACALIHDPQIVLLDEPTLGLDVEASRTVRSWVEKLASEQSKTVLLTTHRLDMAQEVCDRIAIMNRGRLAAEHSVGELLSMFRQESYEITVHGLLEGHRQDFAEWHVEEAFGETKLSATLHGADRLNRALGCLSRLGMPLISVNRIEPNLEDVFLHINENEG